MTQETNDVVTQELIERLEPCPTPWCDGKGGAPYVFERRKDVLGVYCPSCSVSTDYHPTEAAAIAQWNTRDQSQSARIAEQDAGAELLFKRLEHLRDTSGTETRLERGNRAAYNSALELARASLTKDSTSV